MQNAEASDKANRSIPFLSTMVGDVKLKFCISSLIREYIRPVLIRSDKVTYSNEFSIQCFISGNARVMFNVVFLQQFLSSDAVFIILMLFDST